MVQLKQCCASGSLHTGTPTGRIEKVFGLDTYVAEPPCGNPKGVVVIVPDAFGIGLPNNRILADEYARTGNFKVYLPDFMDGFVLPLEVMLSLKALSATGFWNQVYKIGHMLYIMRWFFPLKYFLREAVCGPRVFHFFKSLRANEGATLPVGTAGFCWGGLYVTRLSADTVRTNDNRRLIDCGFVAHPSGLKYPDDIESIQLPYACAAAEDDMMMSSSQAKQTQEILEAKTVKQKTETGVEHEFVMYHGAHHGFAVRADENDKEEAEKGRKAGEQAVGWFSRWFEKPLPA
ncbi:hypothetical protein K431DRAFT_280520 [Polychaeton citri CBS 116435]|uniref:Dienelactone hydrolase domain-containing protein n=1 Tax=Polychaeton citri CBS 116435 TaxID=1314669 RepID=A0A9P4QHD2_9PEZI|nr:hypothetical protein K431DRAFT_280520 [Polychaeton citri CBS 116435]